MKTNAALESYLEPFNQLLYMEGVNEVMVNAPGEVWIEKNGEFYKYPLNVDLMHLIGLGKLIAQSSDQIISEEHPLLSATLPNGYRVQIVFPPACTPGSVCYSIRKFSEISLTLEDYEKMGAFQDAITGDTQDTVKAQLQEYIKTHKIKEFLHTAVAAKKNIIISGGTSTGKTTFTNAVLLSIPPSERILTIEDAREIQLPKHENRLHLLASKGGQGRAKVTAQDLVEAALRLRPDRIILGELRGEEAFSFLRAVNTGHPGSISTIHANTPKAALEVQLPLMVLQAGLGISPEVVKQYIAATIDIVVQLKRGAAGRRYISEIYFKSEEVEI